MKLKIALTVLTLLAVASLSSYALTRNPAPVEACVGGTGEIRIEPHGSYYPLPIMLASPATFNVSVTAHTAYHPNILLVMTNASYQGLIGDVVVEWVGGSSSFPSSSFTAVDNGYVPPSGTTPGVRYQVSGLKNHIGVNGTADDTLWYAYGPFLSGPITTTPQTFNVTLPSTHARMLVYAIGKSKCSGLFDMRVPPTRAGFVVPDLAPILLTLAPFSAFGLYAIKRRKK
jgi:hypothetical protein